MKLQIASSLLQSQITQEQTDLAVDLANVSDAFSGWHGQLCRCSHCNPSKRTTSLLTGALLTIAGLK